MTYKGYRGTVAYTVEDGLFFGQVLGIRGLISYEGKNKDALRVCFEEAIDEYLYDCAISGRLPQAPHYDAPVPLSPEQNIAV